MIDEDGAQYKLCKNQSYVNGDNFAKNVRWLKKYQEHCPRHTCQEIGDSSDSSDSFLGSKSSSMLGKVEVCEEI